MKMSKGGFGKFLAGVAVGIGIGVLIAPKKGSETRHDLKLKMDELLEKAKRLKKEDVKLAIEKKVQEIKEALEDLDKEKVLEIAKKKAKQIQELASNLVDYAVEKGTPVLKKTANEILENVIKVSKETQKRLSEK